MGAEVTKVTIVNEKHLWVLEQLLGFKKTGTVIPASIFQRPVIWEIKGLFFNDSFKSVMNQLTSLRGL